MCLTIKGINLVPGDKIYYYQKGTHDYDWEPWDMCEAQSWDLVSNIIQSQGWRHWWGEHMVYGVLREGLFYHVE